MSRTSDDGTPLRFGNGVSGMPPKLMLTSNEGPTIAENTGILYVIRRRPAR